MSPSGCSSGFPFLTYSLVTPLFFFSAFSFVFPLSGPLFVSSSCDRRPFLHRPSPWACTPFLLGSIVLFFTQKYLNLPSALPSLPISCRVRVTVSLLATYPGSGICFPTPPKNPLFDGTVPSFFFSRPPKISPYPTYLVPPLASRFPRFFLRPL